MPENWKVYKSVLEGNVKGFTHNLVDLSDVNTSYNDVFTRVYDKVKKIKAEIDVECKKKNKFLVDIVIGKSNTKKLKKNKEGEYEEFDHTDPTTWDYVGGVNRHWNTEFRDRDFDGLVVVACITQEAVPERFRNHALGKPEQYAIGLKQDLIKKLLFTDEYPIANGTFTAGSVSDTGFAGLVYMAFRTRGDREE